MTSPTILPMIEIERKFLVKEDIFKELAVRKRLIVQGFLSRDPERTVRIRLSEKKGKLTVKGLASEDGLKRFEWEAELSQTEAESLLDFCLDGIIEKMRYDIPVGDHLYEVDEFFGSNEGLIIAEIELNSEHESFERPNWIGEEVTGQIKYYNSYLSVSPFRSWIDKELSSH